MKNSKKQSLKAQKDKLKAAEKEEKRLRVVPIAKPKPRKIFIETEEGLAKRRAHKSRWCKKVYEYATARRAIKNE